MKDFYIAKSLTGETIRGYAPVIIDNRHFMCIFNSDNFAKFVEINPKTVKELRK